MTRPTASRRGFLGASLGMSALAFAAPTRLLARENAAEIAIHNATATNPLGDPPGVYLNYNELPEGPCPAARKAMADAIPHAGRYSHNMADEMQKVLAQDLGISPDWLLIYPGSGSLLKLAPHAFTSNTRPLVIASPGYEDCVRGAKSAGSPIIEVPLRADGAHDLAAMLQKPAGLVYICNPNNPTGTITPHDQLVQAIESVPTDTIVIVDEAYIHFSNQPSVIPLIASHPNLLVMRTFSKVYGMAGVRCGFAVGRPEVLASLKQYAGDPELSVLAAVGCTASLKQPNLVAERKLLNAKRRDKTIQWLTQAGFTCMPSETNFFMVDVKRPTQEVVNGLLQKGVHVSNRWKMLPTTLRVSIGTEEDMAAFRQAFAEVMGIQTKGKALSPAA